MNEIFEGMLKGGRARERAKLEADRAAIYGGVAVVRDGREYGTERELFKRGCKAIIYVDRSNIGIVSHDRDRFRADHQNIVEAIGRLDKTGEWFFHPSGFLAACGTRKAPAKKRSDMIDHLPELIAAVQLALLDSGAYPVMPLA